MDRFTIRDIEQLTGIKAHTLRIWEQRYGILVPVREGRKHRTYSAEELKRALRISQLYHTGVRISTLALMSEQEIDARLEEVIEEDKQEAPVMQLIEATIAFDEMTFRQVLAKTSADLGVTKTMTRVVNPFLNRIGQMWMNGKVKPGQEHFSSNLIRNYLIQAIERLDKNRKGAPSGKILFFAPEGEEHEIPLLFANYVFRKQGWQTIYLGTNRTIGDVKGLANLHEVNFVFMHPLTNLTHTELPEYVERMAAELTNQQIIVSGPLASSLKPDNARILLLRSEHDLFELTRKWH